jgi:hypothetical protein
MVRASDEHLRGTLRMVSLALVKSRTDATRCRETMLMISYRLSETR